MDKNDVDYSNEIIQGQREIAIKVLEKLEEIEAQKENLLTQRKEITEKLQEISKQRVRFIDFILTFKDLVNNDLNLLNIEGLDNKVFSINEHPEKDMDKWVIYNTNDASINTKPSIADTKKIVIKVLQRRKSISSTSKLQELIEDEGYMVNLNTLKFVLTQNKEVFKFYGNNIGWSLVDNATTEINTNEQQACLIGS